MYSHALRTSLSNEMHVIIEIQELHGLSDELSCKGSVFSLWHVNYENIKDTPTFTTFLNMNIERIKKVFNQHLNLFRPGPNTFLFLGNNNCRYTRWQIFT